MSANLSNNGEASCGPGQASGWNWMVNAGFPTKSRPSTVLSLAFTCLTVNSTTRYYFLQQSMRLRGEGRAFLYWGLLQNH